MRPAGLTAVCIIGLCLAVMGSLGLLGSCAGLAMQPFLEEFMTRFQQGIGGQMQQMEQQLAMQREIMATQMRWRAWLILGFLLQAATVSLLFAGCIKGLNQRVGAHRWLVAAAACGILQGLVQVGVTWAMQRETSVIMMRHMDQIMRSSPGAPMPPGMPRMMSGVMDFSTTLSILFVAVWGLAKIGYFAFTIWYVLTPRIRRLFTPDEPPAAPTIPQPT